MTRKQIIVLAVILALLIVARVVLNRGRASTAAHPEEAGIGRVLDATIDPASVLWIRVTGPPPTSDPQPDPQPGPLELAKSGETWTLTSAEGAAADAASVDAFIESALGLSGDLRAEGESAWPRFGLGPDAAVKVELGGEPGKALATIFIGKVGDGAEAHFARAEGEAPVRHCRDGLRASLGLWSDPAHPAPDLFLQKSILEIEPKDLRSVSIERPDATFTLERGEAADAAWTIKSPTLPFIVQSDSLDGVVSRAARVRIARVLPAASPACASATSGSPASVGGATFTRAEGSAVSTIRLGAIVDGSDEVALRVEGSPTCYALTGFGVPTLMPRASVLWSIPVVFFEMATSESPSRLRYQRAGTTLDVKRSKEGAWSRVGGPVSSARCTSLATALRELRVDDAAEIARIPPELLEVEATVSADLGGRAVKLSLLGARLGSGPGGLSERYARVEGGIAMPEGWIAVIASAQLQALLPSIEDLSSAQGSLDNAGEIGRIDGTGAP